MYDALIFFGTFIAAVTVIQLAMPVAVKVGLVDRPGGHKLHDDHVPLVGGFALYAGLFLAWLLGPYLGLGSINSLFLAASGLLFTIGLVDDRFQLSVRLRLSWASSSPTCSSPCRRERKAPSLPWLRSGCSPFLSWIRWAS